MRNEAPVIELAEWAARLNAETRACMGVSVAPAELLEARGYLDGLMSDEEAAARVAADLAVANAARDVAQSTNNDDLAVANATAADDYAGLAPTFAAACRAADEKQRRKPPDPIIERARWLMADDVSLERAHAEVSKPSGVAASTIMAAEYLIRANDPKQLRQWLDRHSADERAAIQKYLGGKHAAKPRTD